MTDDTVGTRTERLQIGQAVEVRRGSLAGVVGLLLGFTPNGAYTIQVDTLPGVTLVMNSASLRARTREVQTTRQPTRTATIQLKSFLETHMAILIWIIFGAVAGAAARHVMPGPAAGGIPVAVGLGIAGALIGGLAGTFIGGSFASFDVYSLLMAIFASLLVLLGYRSYAMRAIA